MRYSFSQCSSFIKCPKLWYWKYVLGFKPRTEPEYYRQGKEVHKAIETGASEDTLYGKIGLIARDFFDQQRLIEKEIGKEVPLDSSCNDTVICIADALTLGHVVEYKTTSRATPDYVYSQVVSLQARLYGYVFKKEKLLLRLIKKPTARGMKNESERELEERILNEYKINPEKWFQEVEAVIETPDKAIIELKQIIKMMKLCQASGIFPLAAPYGCYTFSACSYMPLCSDFETNKILYEKGGEII